MDIDAIRRRLADLSDEQVALIPQLLRFTLDVAGGDDEIIELAETLGFEVYRHRGATPTSRPHYTLEPAA